MFLSIPNSVFGQVSTASITLPFGAQLSYVNWYPCSNGSFVINYTSSAGNSLIFNKLMFSPTTVIYQYFNLFSPQAWHLGLYDPTQRVCVRYYVTYTEVDVTDGTITLFGTSNL